MTRLFLKFYDALRRTSVAKMSLSREDHDDPVLITRGNDLLVSLAASRLSNTGDSCFDGSHDAVGKGKECIGAHRCASGGVPVLFGLGDSKLHRIDTTGLAASRSKQFLG